MKYENEELIELHYSVVEQVVTALTGKSFSEWVEDTHLTKSNGRVSPEFRCCIGEVPITIPSAKASFLLVGKDRHILELDSYQEKVEAHKADLREYFRILRRQPTIKILIEALEAECRNGEE
jgi:hypothetical protein